jgi:hypothetical protein
LIQDFHLSNNSFKEGLVVFVVKVVSDSLVLLGAENLVSIWEITEQKTTDSTLESAKTNILKQRRPIYE